MRRGLTLPTRQLNASHDAEILFDEEHTDLEVFLGLLSIVLCVFSYNFIVIIHLFFTFFAEKISHSISHSILSRNVIQTSVLCPSFPLLKERKKERKKEKKKRKKKEKKKQAKKKEGKKKKERKRGGEERGEE